MSPWLALALGVVAGFAIAKYASTETKCCATVARGVSAKTGPFGPLLDATGLAVPLGNAVG